jgi:hypothetical protein
LHTELHAPQTYVETLGNALFAPFVLDYILVGPPETHHRAAEEGTAFPGYGGLESIRCAADWTRVAIEENQGNINLVTRHPGADDNGPDENTRVPLGRRSRPCQNSTASYATV